MRPQPLALLVAALLAAPAAASFTVNYTPPFHGAPCTQFAGWESFTQPNNVLNTPDDPASTATGAGVWQLAAGGVITGAGNLDNLTIPPVYRVTDSVPSDLQEVVLQLSMQLNPLSLSAFSLTYLDGLGSPHTLAPASSTYLLHAMGHDEIVVRWDLSAVADNVLAYRLDFAATNSFTTLDAVKLDARFACNPGVGFCSPGFAGVLPCPCANPPGGLDRGCDNSSGTGGATIAASGVASLAADSLAFTTSGEKPTATTILLQGNAVAAGGVAFGQGVRCVAGGLKRLYVRAAVGGSISVPQGADPRVAAQSAALGDPIGGGQHRYYMAYYRDPSVLGGCPSTNTFNGTDAEDVLWAP